MVAIMQWVTANLPVIGVSAGVVLPAVLFLITEYRTQVSYRKVYGRKY